MYLITIQLLDSLESFATRRVVCDAHPQFKVLKVWVSTGTAAISTCEDMEQYLAVPATKKGQGIKAKGVQNPKKEKEKKHASARS
jgi:hypothetical protein